jgi:parvulin-like peptidyl-prolyl isomerase
MRSYLAIALIVGTTVCRGQGIQPQPTPHGPGTTESTTIQPNDVIVTIRDVCDPPSASPCQTQITRAQFERLFRTVSVPNAPFPIPTASAQKYARQLALAQEARKENLENDPSVQAQLHLFETQLLAAAIQKKIQHDESEVSTQDIQGYYTQHKQQFEEITVRSVLVPSPSQANPSGPQVGLGKDDPAAKAIAETVRQRLLAGEDPDKVEKEVFASVNITSPPPAAGTSIRHRNPYLPAPEENALFALNVDGVSPAVPRGDGGFMVFKLESKRLMPLDAVRPEIQKVITAERVKTRLDKILAAQTTELDPRYFKGEQAEREAIELQQKKEREESQAR